MTRGAFGVWGSPVTPRPLDEENTTRVLLGMLEKELVRFRGAETPQAIETKKPSRGARGEEKKDDGAERALREEVEALIATGTDDPLKMLGVGEDADIAEVKNAYQKRVLQYHPDRHSAVVSTDLKSKLSHLLAMASEAFEILSARQERPEAARKAVDLASSRPQLTAPPSRIEVSDETDSFDKEKHGRALFRHAEQAYELRDHWQTIQLCRQAIELYDKEAKFHHLLGIALIRNKKWRKEAALSLKKAVELDEKNPHYLGLLAALYQAEGLQLRADKIIDQVTKIDPS